MFWLIGKYWDKYSSNFACLLYAARIAIISNLGTQLIVNYHMQYEDILSDRLRLEKDII